MSLVILKEKKLLEDFTKRNYKKQNKKEYRLEKAINYMLNGKATTILLTVGLIKKKKKMKKKKRV